MDDLSLFVLDIVQNSIAAQADDIGVVIREDTSADTIALTVVDDGKGMDDHNRPPRRRSVLHHPNDPQSRPGAAVSQDGGRTRRRILPDRIRTGRRHPRRSGLHAKPHRHAPARGHGGNDLLRSACIRTSRNFDMRTSATAGTSAFHSAKSEPS
ncbi:MAG: ATP-binding protein [Bacillus subtilis]|nr:ATP-binding protein [Bacillus subtilis]